MLKTELVSSEPPVENSNYPMPPLRTGSLNQNSSQNLIVSYEVATVRDYGQQNRFKKEANKL